MSSKNAVVSALLALTLNACTPEAPAPQPTPIIPSKSVVASPTPRLPVIDAGAPVTLVPRVEATPVDPLVLPHDMINVDHLGRARLLSSEGDVKGALAEARRALFSTPDDVETLELVAKLARRAGQPQLAVDAWGRVMRLEPGGADACVQQARAFLTLQQFDHAVEAGREATTRDPGHAEAFQVTGIAQLRRRELSAAIASFEKAVELDPTHGWAFNNLGFAALQANENEKAVRALERASTLLPQVAAVQNNLGVALERVGRKDEAKHAYQLAMDLSPKYVKAKVNAARVAQVKPEVLSDVPHPLPEE